MLDRVQNIDKKAAGNEREVLLAHFKSPNRIVIKEILCYVICECNTLYGNYLTLRLSSANKPLTYNVEGGHFHYQCQKCSTESFVIPTQIDVK